MAKLFRARHNEQASKTVVMIGDTVVAILNNRTSAETLAIELNELVYTYVESEALTYQPEKSNGG